MQLIPHIILMLEGFSAFLDETCDTDCDELSPIGDWRTEEVGCNGTRSGCFPNLEQLRRLCPQTLNFLNCKSKAIETCEELAVVPKTNLSVLTKYSMSMENIARDLCNESSSFHQDYVSTINCYKDNYFWNTYICWNLSNRTRHEFIEYMDLKGKDIPNEDNRLPRCVFSILVRI
ncbi:uncharacterized protein LOC129984742 isoform X2 [Argiope bruennichi]|uniref:uncharacterized protein LOC129984742 isoform X2 n=1 Tax=Argiope bruennichi TaxID=94029 RepID=UPI00249554F9|nr:uncharacterized protein LOC129984742 isoform X2 [Argiope bruennichi]